jgi:transposase
VCGFELHADLNASRNIAAKYRASLGRAETGEPPCQPASRGEPSGSLTSRRL